MPSLNEERNIRAAVESTLAAMKRHVIDGDIVIINDGSTDRTREIIEEMMRKNRRIRLVNHDRPMGIGYSFFDGVKESTSDVVVMFPGDNENDPDDALTYFPLMHEVDIIVPFIHNIEIRNRVRRIISSMYRFIINMTFGINVNYTNGTVFYRRCILVDVTLGSTGFFYQAELLIKLIRKGYLFAEVPNFLSVRDSGESKATTIGSLVKVIKSYFKTLYEIHFKRIEGKRHDYTVLNPASVTYKKYSANTP